MQCSVQGEGSMPLPQGSAGPPAACTLPSQPSSLALPQHFRPHWENLAFEHTRRKKELGDLQLASGHPFEGPRASDLGRSFCFH